MVLPSRQAGAESPALLLLDGKKFSDRGEFERALGKFGDALIMIRRLTELSELEPYCEAHYERALVYQRQGRSDKAFEDLTAVINVRPRLAAFYGVVDPEGARKRLDRCIVNAYLRRGENYLHRDETNLAIADFTEALAIDARCFDACFYRGLAYRRLGETAKSEADFLRARDIDRALFDARQPHFVPPLASITLPDTLSSTLDREVDLGPVSGKTDQKAP